MSRVRVGNRLEDCMPISPSSVYIPYHGENNIGESDARPAVKLMTDILEI